MRRKVKFERETNMFGHTYHMINSDSRVKVTEHQDQDWKKNQSRVSQPCYWFRAPQISLPQLQITLESLTHLDGKYQLEVWQSDRSYDASLKIVTESDAATWAWSHTDIWAKWGQTQEQEFKASLKPRKPTKLKVNKDGTVRVKVTVSELSDP